MLEALALGGPGCISATANINATAIAKVIELVSQGDTAGAEALHKDVRRLRMLIQEQGPIPAQKRLLAIASGDARWATVRPPLTAMTAEAGTDLAETLQREYDFVVST